MKILKNVVYLFVSGGQRATQVIIYLIVSGGHKATQFVANSRPANVSKSGGQSSTPYDTADDYKVTQAMQMFLLI